MKKIILLTVLFYFGSKVTYAQPGQFDSSFGTNGIVSSLSGNVTTTAIQSDGKILLAGGTSIARYNQDGSPDNTFGNNGTQTNDFEIVSIAVQGNDKFVVAGSTANDFAVARYNSNGSLDNSFSSDGKLITDFAGTYDVAVSVVIQNDEKIILKGRIGDFAASPYTIVLVRYNVDGSLDNSFGNNGKLDGLNITYGLNVATRSIALQANGKILIVGMKDGNFAVLRFNTDGTPDNTFDGDGIKTIDFGSYEIASAIAIDKDGKIVVSGIFIYPSEAEAMCVARCNADGSLDNSFSSDGKQRMDLEIFGNTENYSLAIEDDGKILLGGFDFAGYSNIIARFSANGDLDSTFNGIGTQHVAGYYHGYVFEYVSDMVINKNKLYAVLNPTRLARYQLIDEAYIRIKSPATNSAFNAPATISIEALAYSPDATVTKVEFYNGATLLHTDDTSPYTFNWTNVAIGNYTLTAKAIYSAGDPITSQQVHVSVLLNQPPTISFQSPSDNASYDGPATIMLKAIANDSHAGGTVAKVEFFNGATLLATLTTSPYDFNWTNVPAGNYTITAKATDNTGLTASAIVHVSVKGVIPTFGFNFNGTNVFNINNGTADPSEAASLVSCNGGQYTTSGHFNSSSSNLYSITIVTSGGKLIIDGNTITDGTGVITAAQLTGSAGTHTVALAAPGVEGSFIQTITPFTDLNNNNILDAGDIAGDPIVFTHTAAAASAQTWYLDADGDQHASASKRSCTSPGTGWTLTVLPVDDCDDNDVTPCINNAPAISLIAPADNKIYLKGANVYITAEASDVDGTISTIEYYSDNKLLHTETDVPQHSFITYKWPRVPLGNHTLTAKATDNGGLVTTSAPIHISVVHNQSPAVNLISPANEENFIAPATIYLEAAATDADGRITKVEFYNGTTLLQTSRLVPYHHKWESVTAGTYTITAVATDNWGAKTTSAPIQISVGNLATCGFDNQPTITYNFNGTSVFNSNNGSVDPSERINVTFCDGDHYTESGYVHSSSSNLYNITDVATGGTIRFDGFVAASVVLTASQLSGVATGTHTVTLDDPNAGGTLVQTITPFEDLNNNGILDAGDCAGDPIIETYTAKRCDNILSRPSSTNIKTTSTPAASLLIAPNPANNILNIYTTGLQKNKQTIISVISSSGVIMKTMQTSNLTQTIKLNVASFASGVYTVKMVSDDKILYKQFVKL